MNEENLVDVASKEDLQEELDAAEDAIKESEEVGTVEWGTVKEEVDEKPKKRGRPKKSVEPPKSSGPRMVTIIKKKGVPMPSSMWDYNWFNVDNKQVWFALLGGESIQVPPGVAEELSGFVTIT